MPAGAAGTGFKPPQRNQRQPNQNPTVGPGGQNATQAKATGGQAHMGTGGAPVTAKQQPGGTGGAGMEMNTNVAQAGGAQAGQAAPGAAAPAQQPVNPNDQMWNDLYAQHEADYGNMQEGVQAYGAQQGRRAAEMSAGLGSNVGGGSFQSGQAQAQLATNQQMMQEERAYRERGLELKMTQLQQQWKSAEAAKDREQMEKIQNMVNTVQIELANLQAGSAPPMTDEGGGGASAPPPQGSLMDPTANQGGESLTDKLQFWKR